MGELGMWARELDRQAREKLAQELVSRTTEEIKSILQRVEEIKKEKETKPK